MSGTNGNLTLQPAATTGDLSIAMDLPQAARSTMALPQGTSLVNIQITGANLPNAITQAVDTAQFVGGKALLSISKIPVGSVTISSTCFAADGSVIASGNAQANIAANQVSTVSLVFVMQSPSGGLALSVDSTISAPTPIVTIGTPSPFLS